MKIRLNDSTDATEIVSIANRFKNCDIDAQFGRYVIDLKSILGVLSFGLPKDIDINIMGPEIDIEIFNEAIKKWRVSVKESRGQPKSGALKQATCKGNF